MLDSLLAVLIIASGLSVRTPKNDTCLDWQVSGKVQTRNVCMEAERERQDGTAYNSGEATIHAKFVQLSAIENTAKNISRQEATVKYPWQTETGLFEAEAGLSIVWAGLNSTGKPAGYTAVSWGNDTLKGSLKVYPALDGLESAHILIEARQTFKGATLHPFIKYVQIRDKKPYIQGKVEVEFNLKGSKSGN